MMKKLRGVLCAAALVSILGLTACGNKDITAKGGKGENAGIIEADTYFERTDITSVTIDSNVTEISNYAFAMCTNLKEITIPDSVRTIGEYAFYGCTKLEKVYIGSKVSLIGSYAFSKCPNLEVIQVSENNNTYDSRNNCNAIITSTSVKLNSTKSVDEDTLVFGCKSTVIPNTVKTIGDYAFRGHNKLESIVIPEGVESIGQEAFAFCSSLTSIDFPNNSLKSVGIDAFEYTNESLFKSYKNAKYIGDSENPYLVCIEAEDTNITSLELHNDTKITVSLSFNNCTKLESLVIGDHLEYVGYKTFISCENLTNLTVGNAINVCNDEDNSKFFYGELPNIETCVITSGVTSIRENAFLGCKKLSSITIPNGITSIGNDAFSGCIALNNVVIPSSVTTIGESAFESCEALTNVSLSDITVISKNMFKDCTKLVSINLPISVTTIGDSAFSGCKKLTTINIPTNVTSIGKSAFNKCSSLTSLELSNNISTLGEKTFYNCSSLTSINIPTSLTSIGNSVFYGCSSLNDVTLHNNITEIGDKAFYGCTSLDNLVLSDNITSYGTSAFDGVIGHKYVLDESNNVEDAYITYLSSNSDTYAYVLSFVLPNDYNLVINTETYLNAIIDSNAFANLSNNVSIYSLTNDFNYSTNATVYLYKEDQPYTDEDGNFWHYVDGVVTVWEKIDRSTTE